MTPERRRYYVAEMVKLNAQFREMVLCHHDNPGQKDIALREAHKAATLKLSDEMKHEGVFSEWGDLQAAADAPEVRASFKEAGFKIHEPR